MPDGITKLTTLQHLALNAPFVPRGRLPPGFGALPLTTLTLWGAHLPDDRALRELTGLTKLEVRHRLITGPLSDAAAGLSCAAGQEAHAALRHCVATRRGPTALG